VFRLEQNVIVCLSVSSSAVLVPGFLAICVQHHCRRFESVSASQSLKMLSQVGDRFVLLLAGFSFMVKIHSLWKLVIYGK